MAKKRKPHHLVRNGGPQSFDELQRRDLKNAVKFLSEFWLGEAKKRTHGKVCDLPDDIRLPEICDEPLPVKPTPIVNIFDQINHRVMPGIVKTSHPLFLGYVTPPSLDICALGDAISAILNQNVAFQELSPAGTAIERAVIRWLCEIIGFGPNSGGVIVSGGSTANLYGLALARQKKLNEKGLQIGVDHGRRKLRVYCSSEVHKSVHKAAMLLGIGSRNVVEINVDGEHRVRIDEMKSMLEKEFSNPDLLPIAIVGACGTRLTGATDDLAALAELANQYKLWFHVDAAFGGFMKMMEPPPVYLDGLTSAHSITLDPHKLLFTPFDCGCLLVKDRSTLLETFGAAGEYEIEKTHAPELDFANQGMQLGRSMKAFKVWLALKYFGRENYAREISRLLSLSQYFAERVQSDKRFELLAPVAGIVVCFRWKGDSRLRGSEIDERNIQIRQKLLHRGDAFLNRVEIEGKAGMRACMANFRTQQFHIDKLLEKVHQYGLEAA